MRVGVPVLLSNKLHLGVQRRVVVLPPRVCCASTLEHPCSRKLYWKIDWNRLENRRKIDWKIREFLRMRLHKIGFEPFVRNRRRWADRAFALKYNTEVQAEGSSCSVMKKYGGEEEGTQTTCLPLLCPFEAELKLRGDRVCPPL